MSSAKPSRLLVIIPDRLSVLIAKGELTARYYNPGEVFDEVHILMTNDDQPDPAKVQKAVGRARLVLHNLPAGHRLFFKTLGWQKMLLASWIRKGIALARQVRPDLIRTHNNFVEGYLASRIKRQLGTPFVTSLHGVWDRDELDSLPRRIRSVLRAKLERACLSAADAVIAVYKPIMRYARDYGGREVYLIYNIVAGWHIAAKKDYTLASPPRLITVNRQRKEKDPSNIIRAIAEIDCEYLLIGDGPYHDQLQQLVQETGCADKVKFIKAMANDDLCALLSTCDLMLSHCDYWGISKTLIEGALAGLPIIVNKHPVEPIPDYEGGWLMTCDNSVDGYRAAISRLLGDDGKRRALGVAAYAHAMDNFDPKAMEEKTASIYHRLAFDKKEQAA
jgi:glycosyltransferase involved in cell wall biosynthesis